MLLDSTATRIVKSQGIDVSALSDPQVLQDRLRAMAGDNAPIPVYLPGEGWNLVFYEESLVLTQLRFFPAVQLLLIAALTWSSLIISSICSSLISALVRLLLLPTLSRW